uniref:Uncharacterized protein n=1 Tax=Oryza sativa subsp. japonica TaxID=39947 RepID=Q84ZQ9_ORYSJ|nr:hypothetical protein [Oryza sativa Japonica Group]BAD30431.1 hypothetical protein [Oryza sativa Japonica Group]
MIKAGRVAAAGGRAVQATRGDGRRGWRAAAGGRTVKVAWDCYQEGWRGVTAVEAGARGSQQESDEGSMGRAVVGNGLPAIPHADPVGGGVGRSTAAAARGAYLFG